MAEIFLVGPLPTLKECKTLFVAILSRLLELYEFSGRSSLTLYGRIPPVIIDNFANGEQNTGKMLGWFSWESGPCTDGRRLLDQLTVKDSSDESLEELVHRLLFRQ